MDLTLTGEWEPYSEGDEDEQLKIGRVTAAVYDLVSWRWSVHDAHVVGHGEGFASKESAKQSAERFVADYLRGKRA